MPPKNRNSAQRRSLVQSFRDAVRGIWRCVQSERNMRIHALACGYVMFFALQIHASRGELALLFLAMGLVTAAEALNTAVEKLSDFVEPARDERIGRIKDMAAGGVLLGAVFAALAGCAVFLRPELRHVLAELAGTPWKLALLAASLIAGGLLVFAVPLKRE